MANRVASVAGLPGELHDPALVAEGGGVIERPAVTGFIGRHGADQRRHFADGGGDHCQRLNDVGHKAPFQEEVAGGIAADHKFGEDHEFRPLGDKGGIGFDDFLPVAGEVADNGVELSETEAHGDGTGT
jgi:hypothetical protein